jgi:hypothetical protein
MKKFEYSKTEYERICEECMLNDEERIILKLRCQSKSAVQILAILEEMNIPISNTTLSRKILKIDNKIKKWVNGIKD